MIKKILTALAIIVAIIIVLKVVGFVVGAMFSVVGLIIIGLIGYFVWKKKSRIKKLL
jgi:hypothetical protein